MSIVVPRQSGLWQHGSGYHQPPEVAVNGVTYRSSIVQNPFSNVWHYREPVPRNARHMRVFELEGTYLIDHADPWNPDFHPFRHLWFDVILKTWKRP